MAFSIVCIVGSVFSIVKWVRSRGTRETANEGHEAKQVASKFANMSADTNPVRRAMIRAVRFVILFSFILFAVHTAAGADAVSIWPVDSLTKVFPDDPVDTHRAIDGTWLIPRNGHTSIQIAIRSNTAIPALRVSLTFGGSLETEVRRVGYVPVHANAPDTPADELARIAPARFPDPLFEGDRFTVPARETTALWITIYAPPHTEPEIYRAEAVLLAGHEHVGRVPLNIKVVNATIPARQALKISTWFYFDEQTMAPYFDVQGKPEELWELLGNIGRVMAAHKQNVFLTPVLSLTDARLNRGRLKYDFSRLDRFVETVSRTGAMELIEGSHLVERTGGYDGPVEISALVAEGAKVKTQRFNPDDPRGVTQLESFLSALYVHLKEKGWLHKYVQHVLDEPKGKDRRFICDTQR